VLLLLMGSYAQAFAVCPSGGNPEAKTPTLLEFYLPTGHEGQTRKEIPMIVLSLEELSSQMHPAKSMQDKILQAPNPFGPTTTPDHCPSAIEIEVVHHESMEALMAHHEIESWSAL